MMENNQLLNGFKRVKRLFRINSTVKILSWANTKNPFNPFNWLNPFKPCGQPGGAKWQGLATLAAVNNFQELRFA